MRQSLILAWLAATSPPATVDFYVTNSVTGEPVANALVVVESTRMAARSDSTGLARLEGLPNGQHEIAVRAIGYEPKRLGIAVSGAREEVLTQLHPVAQRLPGQTVTDSAPSPWLKEFEERRRQDKGYYVTPEELSNSHGSSLPDILERRIPGIRVGGVNDLGRRVYSTRGTNSMAGSCQVAVYLDGMRLFDGNAGTVPVAMLGAIEYYNLGSVPVQYREPARVNPTQRGAAAGGSAACGVLLLWTKG